MRIKPINKFLKFFLPKDVIAIALAPFGIYINSKHINNENTINHEIIHYKQQMELFIMFFYLLYLIEFIFKGYNNISFEKEAYDNENNSNYLNTRKPFSWIKYFKNE